MGSVCTVRVADVPHWALPNQFGGRVSICGMGRGKRADNSLTVIYQIDAHCWRLLWAGKRRSQATLRRGLKMLGLEVVQGLRV